jgi:hypothetical protein
MVQNICFMATGKSKFLNKIKGEGKAKKSLIQKVPSVSPP